MLPSLRHLENGELAGQAVSKFQTSKKGQVKTANPGHTGGPALEDGGWPE